MSHLAKIVKFYRDLDTPNIQSDFSFEVRNKVLSDTLISSIIDIWSIPKANDVLLELSVNKQTFTDSSSAGDISKLENKTFTFLRVRLPRSDKILIFEDINDLLRRSEGINKGKFPNSFYLIKGDYLNNEDADQKKPYSIVKIEHFCDFIKLLIKSGHFLDSEEKNKPNIVFVVNDEESKNALPNKIRLDFNHTLLNEELLDLTPLQEIFRVENNIHKEEKLSTFRMAAWDSLSKTQPKNYTLQYVIKNYKEIIENYKLNYELYIRGFSFSKFIDEVNDFSHKLIQKTHDLIGDIITKTLVIPALFTTWLYVFRLKEKDDIFIIALFVPLLFTAVVLVLVIENQQYLVERLADSTKMTLDRFTKKLSYTNELGFEDKSYVDKYVSNIKEKILSRITSTRNRLIFLRILVWLFVLAPFYLTVIKTWSYSMSLWTVLVTFPLYLTLFTFCFNLNRSKPSQVL